MDSELGNPSLVQAVINARQRFQDENEYIEAWCIAPRTVIRLLDTQTAPIHMPQSYAEDLSSAQHAYPWMIEALESIGLPMPVPDVSPWWVWIRREPEMPAPYANDVPDGYAVMHLRLPASELLISDFDLWHFVLWGSYIAESARDEETYEANTANDSSLAETRMKHSWQRIFDVDFGPLGYHRAPSEKSLQGCIWYLKKDWLIEVLERHQLAELPDSEETA